jgi:hypothetical protein
MIAGSELMYSLTFTTSAYPTGRTTFHLRERLPVQYRARAEKTLTERVALSPAGSGRRREWQSARPARFTSPTPEITGWRCLVLAASSSAPSARASINPTDVLVTEDRRSGEILDVADGAGGRVERFTVAP